MTNDLRELVARKIGPHAWQIKDQGMSDILKLYIEGRHKSIDKSDAVLAALTDAGALDGGNVRALPRKDGVA